MGNNPPLTPCGFEQAEATARWLLSTASIQQIVMSPYIRTLETALPVANVTGLTLHVEYLTSEARQSGGPSRPFNVALDETHRSRLARAQARWALDYGSFPIPTPEGNGEYWGRVRLAAKALRHRFPPSTGNVAIFTHATTSFSLAYGLCYGDNGTDATLQAFVERQGAIGPGGIIHVILASDGQCRSVAQTHGMRRYRAVQVHFRRLSRVVLGALGRHRAWEVLLNSNVNFEYTIKCALAVS
mmetsp:Transcript_33399/g.91392  ORF Transcript_33399/g.91392 Transcript_33399/m.91392 type:complete len:243 (+) Transcript_33399:1584-2312(+)